MTVMEKLLEFKDLRVTYEVEGEISHAVNGVNLSVCRGEVLGLVGETGAGKTTTAKAALKLLPKYTAKISGEVILDGKNINDMTEKELCDVRGNKVSMVFQDPMTSLNPVFRVGKQIGDVIKLHNPEMDKKRVEAEVDNILKMVGIVPDRKNEYPHQFSGGMKQRVMIAIAIACKPDLLIADEPTTALDVTIQAQVMEMMRGLQKELNSAVMLITHDLGLVANFCDKVAIMYSGEIIEYGTIYDIFNETKAHHPYTVGLFGSIPDIDDISDRLHPIPGLMPHPADLPQGCKFAPRCPNATDGCLGGDMPVREKGTHTIKCLHVAEEAL